MGKETEKSSPLIKILLIILIVLQIALLIFRFTVQKTSHYEDEFFSYGISNSYDRPFLYGEKLYSMDNCDTWLTGDDFKYYIRTNDETRFSYANTMRNSSADTLPPLYNLILHTISSFFPDRFSWWWGFIINLFAFAASQLVLFKLSEKLSGSKKLSLLVCLFYGFSIAAQNISLFIRMYALENFLILLFMLLSVSFMQDENVRAKQKLFLLCFVTLLGALTHHLFLVFAFFFTLAVCVVLLFKKRIGSMFKYGLCVLAGVLLSIAVFPATISHLLGSNSVIWFSVIDPGYNKFVFTSILFEEVTGYHLLAAGTGNHVYVVIAFVTLAVLFAAVTFLMRTNEKYMGFLKNTLKAIGHYLKYGDYSLPVIVISSVAYHIFVIHNVAFFDLFDYVDRYLFKLMPILSMVILCVLYKVISGICNKIDLHKVSKAALGNIVISVLAIACIVSVVYQNSSLKENLFLYNQPAETTNGRINEHINKDDCLLLLRSSVFLPCFSEALENAGNVYVAQDNYEHIKEKEDILEKFRNKDSYYLLMFERTNSDSDTQDASSGQQIEITDNDLNAEETDFPQLLSHQNSAVLDSEEKSRLIGDLTEKNALEITTETIHSSKIVLYKMERK